MNLSVITSVTAWGRILFEKLLVTDLAKKFSVSYRNQKFITVLMRARHWSLS
jgi:hypothetical protein